MSINNNISSVKKIGLFLSSVFVILVITNIIVALLHFDNFLIKLTDPSILLSLILAVLFYVSTFFNNKLVKYMHVIFVLLSGVLTILLANNFSDIHGEFIIILGMMMAKIYGLIGKKDRLFIIFAIICCYIIKFASDISFTLEQPSEFFYHMILVSFFAIFFLLILESEESKMADEASIICAQWTKEQVYNDIGRSVYSTFMHDYHTDHAITHLETLEEIIDEGSKDEAKIMIQELRNMLSDDNDNILRVKEKIRLSVKEKPEIIDSKKFVSDKIRYFKKAYNLCDSEISEYYNLNHKFDFYIIPLDFIGIIENLVKNAIEASSNMKSIKVLLGHEAGKGIISVTNRGNMIPWRNSDGTVPLETFRVGRTTKEKGSGWGVYSIIKRVYANNGTIKITSKNGETEFLLSFPIKTKEFNNNKNKKEVIGVY